MTDSSNKGVAGVLSLAGLASLLAAATVQAQVERISLTDGGEQADADSYEASISDDGEVIAFASNAANLVPGDTNAWTDVFVRDLVAGTTEQVSRQPDGDQSVSWSRKPSLSDDGSVVVFQGKWGQFSVVSATDRDSGTTAHLVPMDSRGDPTGPEQAQLEPVVAGNGRYVAFHTHDDLYNAWPANIRPSSDEFDGGMQDVFVLDRTANPAPPMDRVSRSADNNDDRGDSYSGSLSDDGQVVAFYSYADELVTGASHDNDFEDIYVRDRQAGVTELVSQPGGGVLSNGDSYNPVVSGNGRFVVFRSQASNLVPDDTNRQWDIFVHDRNTSQIERVSVASDGTEANRGSFEPDISDDGRYVVFRSNASNLVDGDTNARFDIFVHDRDTGETARVSLTADGGEADGLSYQPVISGDGRWIAFESDATNLVADDTNGARDIFRVANPL